MGAWEIGPFGNDDALDWLAEFEEKRFDALSRAFEATAGQDYLEQGEGSAAVAAAAVLASLLDGKHEMIPDDAQSMVAELSSERGAAEAFREPAIAALDRVLATDSELEELWAETDDLAGWRKHLTDIRRRLEQT